MRFFSSFVALASTAAATLVASEAAATPAAQSAVASGVGFVAVDASGRAIDCTIGFVLATPKNDPVALTAGHCATALDGGQDTTVWLNYEPAGGLTPIGHWRYHEYQDTGRAGDRDIGFIGLDAGPVPIDAASVAGAPVAGFLRAGELKEGDPLCYRSPLRGEVCGTLVHVDSNGEKAYISGAGEEGESGAGVYKALSDGSAALVGIVDGYSPASDSAPATVDVELVAPWIDRFDLRAYSPS